MTKFKEFLKRQADSTDSVRGLLVAIVGGYIAYLGWQMYGDTKAGVSSMSMPVTIALMVVMILVGVAVCAFGLYLSWACWKKATEDIPNGKYDDKESER